MLPKVAMRLRISALLVRRIERHFPSTIPEEPLLGLLLPEVARCPHAEERRLFYVAMTRCKKKLFFIVDQTRRRDSCMNCIARSARTFSEESNFLRNARIAAEA